MADSKILIYLMRRDLRLSDNPIFHSLSKDNQGFTHLLPLYVFPAQQVEVSGFIPKDSTAKSPYPEARSPVGAFWRCGPHRTKFVAEAVWDLKTHLQKVNSDLLLRVGMTGEVVQELLRRINERNDTSVGAVWMTAEDAVEEKQDEAEVRAACSEADVKFKLWKDEKYLVDDDDVPFKDPKDLNDVFTNYRKTVEPLRERPRPVLLTPKKGSLPSYPAEDVIPPQHSPFSIPQELDDLQEALWRPLQDLGVKEPPKFPKGTKSAHPFEGGETTSHERLEHLMSSGAMTAYKDTRNGMLGEDFSSKLSAWLALGNITARQIHSSLLDFEDGKNDNWKGTHGYGKGENAGTKAMRFELLWRDYMRLCTRKFGSKLFRLGGFRGEHHSRWEHPTSHKGGVTFDIPRNVQIERFLNGTTGMGLIDASQRELYHTGYTSNRARQNVASFLAKKLNIDWRIGAEWYECMLADYDVSSNWGNWQYVAGVGNDPRGEDRVFNPVKQAFDYDPEGEYVKAWMEEVRHADLQPKEIFQPWTVIADRRRSLGLDTLVSVEKPLVRIDFQVGRKGGKSNHRGGRGGSRGNGGGGSPPRNNQNNYYQQGASTNQSNSYNNGNWSRNGNSGGYGGRGYGSSRGHLRGGGGGGGGQRWYGTGGGARYGPGGAREGERTGMMDKEREVAEGGLA